MAGVRIVVSAGRPRRRCGKENDNTYKARSGNAASPLLLKWQTLRESDSWLAEFLKAFAFGVVAPFRLNAYKVRQCNLEESA